MIALELVLEASRSLCARASCDLVLPGDPRREAVVLALGAWHRLRGGAAAWDLAYARDNVSVTVPAMSPALSLLGALPVVGEVFRAVGASARRPTVYLAPGALRDGVTAAAVISHELGHVRRLAAGGALWCVAYGAVPEARAADEAACYGQDLSARVVLAGDDADAAAEGCLRSLAHYDLDEPSMQLAAAILDVHRRSLRAGAIPGGPFVDMLRELEARGAKLPPPWRVPGEAAIPPPPAPAVVGPGPTTDGDQ